VCLARKIEWDDVSLAKAIRSLQQVIKIDAESRVQVHSLPRWACISSERGPTATPWVRWSSGRPEI
jgi:hypothetical protein